MPAPRIQVKIEPYTYMHGNRKVEGVCIRFADQTIPFATEDAAKEFARDRGLEVVTE